MGYVPLFRGFERLSNSVLVLILVLALILILVLLVLIVLVLILILIVVLILVLHISTTPFYKIAPSVCVTGSAFMRQKIFIFGDTPPRIDSGNGSPPSDRAEATGKRTRQGQKSTAGSARASQR